MKTEILSARDPFALPHAVDVLRKGGLVAFPTDTVYGLGSLAFDPMSVDRLYVAKGRSHEKAVAILLSDAGQLSKVTQKLEVSAQKLAAKFWPGPLTIIVNRHPIVPDAVSPLPTVGVRVPDHLIALKLLAMAGPMAVTSANLSGEQSANTTREVMQQLGGRIHLILDGGRSPGGIPSTVVDCTQSEPVILRPGPISILQIKNALK
ncbi:MAG TPA: L-threonylcarbamoyladenylate synthase [Anaerolineales bacterium]|jgi:L-threonylcarbamoyladenylate synthase|nr:L-threonylcarbamoyladenylate synthase [Anaerolineales bacterium]